MISKNSDAISLKDTEFSVLDVETTGLSAKTNNVIEIGIVRIKNLRITKKFQTFINPGYDIPYFITQLTGISNEDVYEAPSFCDVLSDIKTFIGDSVVAAHNLSFDDSFLTYEFIRNGTEPLTNDKVCTLKIARRLFPTLKSKSLSSITRYLNLKNTNAHRALADAEVTARALLKMIKDLQKSEQINYLDELINYQKSALSSNTSIKIAPKFRDEVYSLPNAPGIYYFLNQKDQIIYIGKAKSLRDRVKSYFSSTASRKAKKIVKQSVKLKTEITNTELTALITEAESIKLLKPKHNSQLKKYGSKYFIRVTKIHKYPKLEISNHFDFDGNDYFGLFISRKRAEKVLEIIDRTFLIRECTDKEFSKRKKCFLADIERCNAPCADENKLLYEDELEKVYEFLYGKNHTALDRLLKKMKEYSALQKYEKAAEAKEVIDLILMQTHKSSLLAEPVNKANVLFEITENRCKDYILLISGKIHVKSYIHNKSDTFSTALSDYYTQTVNINNFPTEEDLEKIRITLNWLIKNRNKVRAFYLKEFENKESLYHSISSFNKIQPPPEISYYDLNSLTETFTVVKT